MVFGAMNDKAVGEIGSILFPKADRLVLTRANNSRATPPELLLEAIPRDVDSAKAILTDNVEAAIAKARELSGHDGLILVTGSLYLVGEVRRMLSAQAPDKLKTRN
jgi:dihydrofolate synthase/folylpolyglutamate synthase